MVSFLLANEDEDDHNYLDDEDDKERFLEGDDVKDEDKDAALSLWNKRSQMATNQQSLLSLGGKHSLIIKHQHHILTTNHSMPTVQY